MLNKRKYFKWNVTVLICAIGLLIVIALINFYVDPVFHYRAPRNEFSYLLAYHRYQNNGIVKNMDYDTLITGTSMVDNFKTSECDTIFQSKSIKVAFPGASYKK